MLQTGHIYILEKKRKQTKQEDEHWYSTLKLFNDIDKSAIIILKPFNGTSKVCNMQLLIMQMLHNNSIFNYNFMV